MTDVFRNPKKQFFVIVFLISLYWGWDIANVALNVSTAVLTETLPSIENRINNVLSAMESDGIDITPTEPELIIRGIHAFMREFQDVMSLRHTVHIGWSILGSLVALTIPFVTKWLLHKGYI